MKKSILAVSILLIVIMAAAIAGLSWMLWFKDATQEVRVFSVKPGQEITSPLIVEGQARGAWFFEATFPIRIVDENNNALGSSFVRATADWMTESFVPFRGEITFASSKEQNGFLILAKDNPSGLPQYDKEARLPVKIMPTGMMKIKAYFNNSNLDPEASCNKVFEVKREIIKIEAIGSAAVNQLLNGPTEQEKAQGFFTSINPGVILQNLRIDEGGTAYADFDSRLEYQIGGSCRVSAIRAQITETLKQFPTVKNVVISINGRTEDILQP